MDSQEKNEKTVLACILPLQLYDPLLIQAILYR
jgi:hypothetical protein